MYQRRRLFAVTPRPLLLMLALAAAGVSGVGEADNPGRDPCDSLESVTLRDGDAGATTLETPAGALDVRRVWSGNLNADRFDDAIVLVADTASSWGEFEHLVLLSCGDEGYVQVFGPEYAVELVPADRRDNGWLNLELIVRSDSMVEPGTTKRRLQFNGTRYAPAGD